MRKAAMHEEYFKAGMELSRACLHLARQYEPMAAPWVVEARLDARMLLMGLLGELKSEYEAAVAVQRKTAGLGKAKR